MGQVVDFPGRPSFTHSLSGVLSTRTVSRLRQSPSLCYDPRLVQPARILVIEDNAFDIVLLRHALDKQGEDYELEVLSDGEAALRFVHEHRTRHRAPEPCVILLDLYLPVYDGMAVLRAIREAPPLEHIHVMVWTTLASPGQQIEIASMGALYRNKSTSLKDVIELAAEIIAICKSSSTTAA
jgi:CheY-like chemotaxis protein